MTKRTRSIIKQFVPYGIMVSWLCKHYGYKIDEPLFFYKGFLTRVGRIVKFLLPYGLVSCIRRPYDGLAGERKISWFYRKTKKNLREYGVLWTIKKIRDYLLGYRAADIEDASVLNGVDRSKVISEEFFSSAFDSNLDKGFESEVATVVVPVYNGLNHLERLCPSLLKNTPSSFPILIINDASPDPAVAFWLEDLAKKNPDRIKLVTNEENLGFVKTANKAFRMTTGHVILLNSDTEVPSGWTSKLMRCLNDKVASVTPFSNAASIMSFPLLRDNNRWLIDTFDVEDISEAFSGLSLRSEFRVAPCGVGFCMLMNRSVIDKIGIFDEVTWGKGYCEEVDWCHRAYLAGFENVIASDLFVAHYDGGSFTSKEKFEKGYEHEKIFAKMYPDFHQHRYLSHLENVDPYWGGVRNIALLRFFTQKRFRPVMIIANGLVGGSAAYLQNFSEQRDRTIIYVQPTNGSLIITVQYGDFTHKIKVSSFDVLIEHALVCACSEIVVNHFLKWEQYFGEEIFSTDVYRKMIDVLERMKNRLGSKLTFLFHDFFSICPCYTLLDSTNKYCNPTHDVNACSKCLPNTKDLAGIGTLLEMRMWRDTAKRFFDICDEVRFFSENTRSIVLNVVDFDHNKATVVPHKPLTVFSPIEVSNTQELRIGIVGGINRCKGADFIEDFSKYLAKVNPNARIVIIGAIDHPPYPKNVIVHGPYEHDRLPELIKRYGVNIAFQSSIWPETFSYVTQELMMMDVPTVCFNLGAPADRIRMWDRGRVIADITPECAYRAIVELFGTVYGLNIAR